MTKKEFFRLCISIVEEMRADFVPNPKTRYKTSTGNMAFNALKYRIDGNAFIVYVDEDIAPYVWYTLKPWLSPKWHGKRNPNQDWNKAFAQEFSYRLRAKLKGVLS